MLLLKLGWRNSLRNKRRTFLTGLVIGIGLAGLIFTDSLIIGMCGTMIRTATDTFLGQAVINREGFRNTLDIDETVVDGTKILEELKSEKNVSRFAPRSTATAILTSSHNTASVMLYGIDPTLEKPMSKMDEAVIEGDYLSPGKGEKILIGEDLAKTLHVGIGDRIVVRVAQAGTGDLQAELMFVGGIFRFGAREMDMGIAFINLDKSQEILALGDRFHEITVDFENLDMASDKSLAFWGKYSKNGNEAKGWKDLMPELSAALEMTDFSIGIISFILFGVVVLAVMNTLFMALYERMFEFGVLRAVGTRPLKMASMILVETGVLGIFSVVIGSILGLVVTLIFKHYGIDYSGVEFAGVTIGDPIYPVMRMTQYVKYPVMLLIFTMIVGVYPAIYAARLRPVVALHKTL